MAAARGVLFMKTNPSIGFQCPTFLRQQLLQSFGVCQEITKRSYSRFSIQGNNDRKFDDFNSSLLSGQSRLKRELLLPLTTLVDAKVIYSTAPAFGHNQEGHPECKARVTSIIKGLNKAGFGEESQSNFVLNLKISDQATIEDVAAVHNMSYVRGLKEIMTRAKKEKMIVLDDMGPTYATQNTYSEAMIGAGTSLAVVDHVLAAARETASPPIGFALVRPPGHHAVATRPMGFCIFGNVAVAARHVQRVHGLKKVFIIDFDVHHGNGTNDIFYEDPDVYYLSTHQVGSFPGTGKMHDVGEGRGEGASLNLPLPGGSGDEAMSAVFDEIIAPAAQRFRPDIILVSAGYDAHYLDQLAGLQFTTGTYYRLTSNIKELALQLCGGRCVFFLEGGYDLKALTNSVVDTFRALLGEKSEAARFDNPAVLYDEPSVLVRRSIDEIKAIHSL